MPIDDPWNPILLTLASITYRGFARPAATPAILRRAMDELLSGLAPVKDEWELVWGPAGFRAGPHPFDDAAMYVVRRRRQPSQVVVAVRGTNPVSLFDWVFGDFMVARQVPWLYGDAAGSGDAKVSFSTALGLSMLQRLRWNPDAASPAPLPQRAARAAAEVRGAAAELLPPLAGNVRQSLRVLRGQLTRNIRAANAITAPLSNDSFASWVETMRRRNMSPEAASGLEAYDRSVQQLSGRQLDPLLLVLGGTAIRQSFTKGLTVQRLLADLVAQSNGPLDVFVTGHSKGGAVSTALAAWLADTQGQAPVAPADRWDPDCKATVHAYSFASPTPGNSGFARHVDTVLGARCHRITNHFDIVPHAFAAPDIESIPTLYDAPAIERAALAKLAARLRRSVEHLDYQHAGSDHVPLPGRRLAGRRLVAQVVHQHIDGYFEQLGLDGEMGRPTFFAPF